MNLRTWCRHGWMPACLLLLMAITHTDSSETRVVCYYTNWSVYRPGTAKFSPQNINPYLCTHLIYAFGGFTKENSLKPFDKYQDIEKGGYAKFTGLKTYNKNLKTMLAIGGWNEGSSRFSPMVANSDRRKELVKNAVKFLRQNHFDGLDLDWEYPSFRDGGKARDRENYAQLVQELREEFDRESEKTGRPRLLLTMAVPAGIEYINKGYDIPKLTKYLDWMNILSYDYHSAFEPAVNHHSPLYPLEEENEYNFDADLNIDHTIKHYLKMGADPNKLVLGIPTYGRSYTLYNPDANEIGAPADGPGDMGDATRENGYLAFYEICENLKENDWKVVQPNPSAMGPYAYKDNQWVSYDDELIVKKKSEYVVENNLGGIMFWSIDNDDFRGHCYNKPYPLIEAAKEALIAAASGKTETNLVSGSTKPRKPLNSRGRTRPTISSGSKKEESASTGRIQNSGGRQGGDEVSNSSGSRKRIRTGSRNKNRDEETFEHKEVKTQQRNRGRGSGRRRKTTTTAAPTTTTTLRTTSILQQTTPTWKTPEPPTTPDPGGDFKCEEDGFFPHPRDCKKYFWCLSGPADLGIIAHQFTCPAGLYFNKLADSCDYTQNVLCKKNSKTTTTTAPTTSATSTTTTEAPSTTRRPARITAATSRTTFLYTSTTTTEEPEYYDDEYEYEDEEEADNAPRRGEPDSEEDPRVIKELIDLIKKVGGVEELEKYLKLQEDGTMAVTDNAGSTTPATISRSLYERVLSRANAAKTSTSTKTQSRNSLTYAAINRNSRPGPQNAGIDKKENDDESTKSRGRPKYTTITRQRASTEKVIEDNESEDEEIDDEEEVKSIRTRQFPSRKSKQPEYVTIKRSRPTATSDVEEEEAPSRKILRGRQRGVPGEEAEEQENLSDGTQSPEYVTIRRNRPTTEESSTSKYTTIQRRRPATETQDDAETTTGGEFSRRRSTTVAPEDISSTTIETSPSTILSTQDKTETAVETTSNIEDENETVPSSVVVTTETTTDVKSTIENTVTESSTIINQDTAQSTTLVQTTKAASSTELPSKSKDKSTNQISENAQTQESSSEKTSPQLFRPRPFATRTRGTTTSKPTTETTEVPVKKVSEKSGIKSSAPSRSFGSFNRKFQAGNRFSTIKGQAQNQNDIVGSNVDNSSQGNKFSSSSDNSNIRVDVVTEDYIEDDEETIKQKEEDFRRRIRNRGRSKFTLPTSTVEPTVARRRRPVVQSVTGEYEYDYEEPQRTYRPSVLADLSSLTSVDIAFQRDNKRKHIRRRPVTTSQVSTTTTTSERPTEPGLKTGPRTLPLARKLISESQFGKNSRRVLPTTRNLEISTATTESSKEINQVTRNSLLLKPRPSFSNLFRTRSTTPQSTDNNSNVEIASNINTSKAPPLLRTTQVNTEENNNDITESSLPEIIDSTSTLPGTEETPTQKETDSTESQSEKEYKTIKPDATSSLTTEANINIDDNVVTTEIFEQSSSITETDEEVSKPTLAIKRKILRPTTTAVPNLAEETSKIEAERTLNRTRKIIIANRRLRTTTVPTTDEKITTNFEIKRQRSTFLTRNLQRQNITRLRPVKTQDDELETNVTSESNRGFVKRIRPADFDKTDDEEKIKLSETNISENIGIVRNLPEDETNKQRRRKIIRRIRPSKDTIYSESKNEDDFETNKRIRLSNKRILEEENNEQDVTRRNRIRNFGSIKTTDNIQQESNIKRIRPFLSKSESTDILRSNNEDNINEDTQTEQENNTEIDEQTTVNNIRHGKELFDEIEEKEISTIETNATEKQNEDDTEQNIDEEITENIGTTYKIKESKQTPSTLYKPTPNTRKIKFLDTFTTSESPNIIRNRNIIRKFRPGLATNNTRNLLVENNRIGNRTRKIIRRLRPSSSTTTESINVATSTVSTTTPTEPTDSTDNDFFTTTENILTTFITEFKNLLPTTEYSNDEITQESVTELEDTENDITTIPTTEQTEQPTTVTTTTSKPRPTRPSLIGRSRPAYRPRNRPQIEIRSTTPTVISPSSFRRRLNKNEATPKPDSQEVEKQETDDGIIDDKLKKLYDKKIKYTPIVRSTTERIKAHEEEEKDKIKEIKNVSTEQEELNTEFNADVTTVTEDTNEKLITDSITTENILDTTIIDGDLTTLVTTENIKQSETTMQVSTDSETKTTMSTTTSEAITTASTTEDFTENVIITTEVVGNTETENPVTEFVTETNIPDFKVDDSVSSTTTEITPETTKISETTTNFESTSPSSLNENINKSTETDKSYKPIRFKPGDRPKLRIKLNRTDTSESENERNETNEQRNRFTPSRTLAQRNRSKLAYRKETSTEKSDNTGDEKEEPTRTFIPTGRKLERPKFDVNQIKNESPSDSVVESKSERSHYPTLKPVSESFIFNRNQNVDEQLDDDEEGDEEYEEEIIEQEEPKQIENPVIKYLQTIRNNQEIIRVNGGNIPQEYADNEDVVEENVEDVPDEEEEEEEIENEEEEEELEDIVEHEKDETLPKANVPIYNAPVLNRPSFNNRPSQIANQPNIPNRVSNRPQYSPKRPVVNKPLPGPQPINRPYINEPPKPISNIPTGSGINIPNRPAPALPSNAGNRNYPRRFNKPVNPTVSSTTPESLAGINIEAVNQRNKNLFIKNRKANIPHPGPAVTSSTASNNELEETLNKTETTTEIPIDISQVTEETILPEPTTEQLSTLHHIFAEPDTTQPSVDVTTSSVDSTTKYNFTAAQIEAARSLERLIEVNRIVEVSLKEDKVNNTSGIIETRVMLEKVPTLDRIGAINRVTVIKVVDGNNETHDTFPSNHAFTLNEIITGKKLDIDSNIDVVAQLHAPDINLTKLNILNNTLEIIKHEKSTTTVEPEIETTASPTTTEQTITQTDLPEKIPEGTVHVVNGPKILDQIINDTVQISTTEKQEKKFEIVGRSNVVDYSHRDLDPIQLIAQARPDPNLSKQGRKLAIDSKSVVANNNRPVFVEATTLPLEALFQTDSPDFNHLKTDVSTQDAITTTGKEVDNDLSDDQDLLESRNHNGRVRIRILGEDLNSYTSLEKAGNPVYAPIRILKDEEIPKPEVVTLKAEVVEVKAKPGVETIRIAPIEVALSNSNVKLPSVRVETSQSISSSSKTSKTKENQNSVPLKRELSTDYFNPVVIFGDTVNSRK